MFYVWWVKAQIRCGLLLNEYPAAHFKSEVAWAVMSMTKLLCMHTRDDVTLCQECCSAQAGPVAQARDLFKSLGVQRTVSAV